MKRSALVIAIILTAGALMTAGCCDTYKDRIAVLQNENAALQADKTAKDDLEKRLAGSQERCDELLVEVESKQTEIAGLRAQLAEERTKKPPVATKPTVPAGWQETATGAKITLGSDILFGAGRAVPSARGLASLKAVAAAIKTTYPTAMVRVYGFTDSDRIVKSAKLWADNLDLSANRAMAVTRELRKLGVPAANIETVAMGKERPVASNTSQASKARNRRVEIVVIKP
jgi:outer membrane protein OmpA-like peptidoglycan-associated protein